MLTKVKRIFRGADAESGSDSIEKLAELAGLRAENFFQQYRLSCSEASLLVINAGFGGGLTSEQAINLGSGFGGGVGGSGCICGAISGSVMALGLFLGPGCRKGLGKKKLRKLIAGFHDNFRQQSGSVCCRELIADFRNDRKGQGLFCRGLTGRSTSEAVRVILEHRPELLGESDMEFLQGHESAATVVLRKIFPLDKGEK